MDKTNHRRRPLHLAAIKRRPSALATLLQLGADTSARDAAGLTPLDQAALDGEREMARLLIDHGAQFELPAAEHSPGSVIDAPIRYGASVDAQDDAETAVDDTRGYTPLHAAAFAGNADAVRVLLAHGADTRMRDGKYLATAAGWADYAGHSAIRDMILERSADVFDAIRFDRVDV